MKKILSLFALAGLALTGCVDDNPSVIFNGFMEADTCSPSGGDQIFKLGLTCDPSAAMNTLPYAYLDISINNYITGKPPWNSSGGGNNTTFEPDIPNQGLIFLERIVAKCHSIDGDLNACQGIEPITYELAAPISGNGGGYCLFNFGLDYATIASWGGSHIILDVYGEYHDASLMTGQTSHDKFNVRFISSSDPTKACSYVPPKDEGNEE